MSEYLIRNRTGEALYRGVRNLPIYDYHCHLFPKEIFLDEPFQDIAVLWLSGDHYKWRLMRASGIPERCITGDAPYDEKFRAYARAIEYAAGNPLYHWTQMELSTYFGITEPLTEQNADRIREKANRVIAEEALSPRKLILRSGVRLIGTTDDVADDLVWHRKLADTAFSKEVRVIPSFRCDKALLVRAPDYSDYLKCLSSRVGFEIRDFGSLKEALVHRLDDFVALGCRFTDLGIPYFPDRISVDCEAAETFSSALRGEEIPDSAFLGLLGNLIVFLGKEYRKRNLVMQLHIAVERNVNSALFALCGPDSGGDCIGDPIPGKDLIRILDAIESDGGLPETVLYTLNPAMHAELASIAGSFPRVRCGAAWWFCDHKRGIYDLLETVAETGTLSAFLGMLTDSRSFLSYARHDYFRRILCSLIGDWVENGEFPMASAPALLEKICYRNIAALCD